MNAKLLGILIQKDLMLYFRNRYFAIITVLGLGMYILIYSVLPAQVDERFSLGLYAPTLPDALAQFLSGEEMVIAMLDSDEALQQAVINAEYMAGVVLTGDVLSALLRGEETTITVYFASDAPSEMVNALSTVLGIAFNEWGYAMRGEALRLDFQQEILGPDMTGEQIAFRNRLLPLLAVMLLITEVMGLGSLIAEEKVAGTLRALLITPVTLPGLFLAKTAVGVLLAFVPASLLMGITGNLMHAPLLILTTLLLGALTATGLAFFVASASDGMMSALAWGMMIIIVMMIPSYGVVFPGMVNDWAKFIPSYYMFDTIHQVVNFGASWDAVMTNLVVLLVMGIALMVAGIGVMQRKLS